MITLDQVEKARRNYASLLRQFMIEGNSYHDRAPLLPHNLIRNCQLIVDRYELLKLIPKHGICAEIGTDKAAFAKKILELTDPKKLHIFELDTSRIEYENIQIAIEVGKCSVVEGDSAVNLSKFDDCFFDWVYIDGDHRYGGVKKDLEIAAQKVKQDGLIVLNDYTTWSPVGMTHCGVARAVNEFCIENNYELIFMAFQTMFYNDVVIRRVD
ncbi:class I SAM-dependent methyltransferase [Roseibium aggregatum]|uniref:class I SAM-dependent methyltransferase n=1 Tax=Roseibium aggregatum TaxID=187304 RepID=UPI0025AB9C7B|nr:class I SAM-dependent methyltransferase [Roseibium aggregatum]WJS01669.1 class I SAM-dependent methyltransferase [Roseibium aggregatum]